MASSTRVKRVGLRRSTATLPACRSAPRQMRSMAATALAG